MDAGAAPGQGGEQVDEVVGGSVAGAEVGGGEARAMVSAARYSQHCKSDSSRMKIVFVP